jgi:hypothetical protein
MRRFPAKLAWTILTVALPVAGAGAPALAAGEAEVRLYTNEDLARFPVLPDSTVAAEKPAREEWAGVVAYLEREHARIDADRAHRLERDRAEAEVEFIQRQGDRRRYSLPYDAWRYGHGRPDRLRATSFRTGGAIRPLHAGPTRSQIDYFKATRRSGADAVPQRSRPRVGPGKSK